MRQWVITWRRAANEKGGAIRVREMFETLGASRRESEKLLGHVQAPRVPRSTRGRVGDLVTGIVKGGSPPAHLAAVVAVGQFILEQDGAYPVMKAEKVDMFARVYLKALLGKD